MESMIAKLTTTEAGHAIMVVFVVLFGSIVHATAQLKVHRDKDLEFTAADFGILFIIATFSGMIFGMLAMLIWTSTLIVSLFSAVGAFLGMAGLNKIANILLEVITNAASRK